MAIYLAEMYLSRERASDLGAISGRLRDAHPVRHLFSFFVAEDETAFHCLQGPTPDAVRQALERAGVAPDRVVAAQSFYPEPATGWEDGAGSG